MGKYRLFLNFKKSSTKFKPISYKKKLLNPIYKKNSIVLGDIIYFKNRVIGKGSYSIVYYGIDKRKNYDIAVKEFNECANIFLL